MARLDTRNHHPILTLSIDSFRYAETDHTVISKFNLDLNDGQCILLTGEIGSGKSTLLALAAGLWPEYLNGDFSGHRLLYPALHSKKTSVRFLFQDPDLNFLGTTVGNELSFALDSSNLSANHALERFRYLIHQFDLAPFLNEKISHLSLGVKQWIALAGCLISKPSLLILDEPTCYLDRQRRLRFIDILSDFLNSPEPTAALVATHDLNISEALGIQVTQLPNRHGTPTLTGFHIASGGPSSTRTLMRATNLSYSYDGTTPVVKGIDINIQEGDCLVITGPNGSGKSTLAHLLAGLLKPTSGDLVDGNGDALTLPNAMYVGYVSQVSGSQLFGKTIQEELCLTPESLNIPPVAQANTLVSHLPETRDPFSLSIGQRRKLQIAAFGGIPNILIVDEPPLDQGSVDYVTASFLLANHKGSNRALVVCTHDPDLWEKHATTILVLGPDTSSIGVNPLVNVNEDTPRATRYKCLFSPLSRAIYLSCLFLGLMAQSRLSFLMFLILGLGSLIIMNPRSLLNYLLWLPPVAVGFLSLVVGGIFAPSDDLIVESLFASGRMLLICATGVLFPLLLDERDIAVIARRLRQIPMGVALTAAYRTVPGCIHILDEVIKGMASRGLFPQGKKPLYWFSAFGRMLSASMVLILESALNLARLMEFRDACSLGRLDLRKSERRWSILLMVLSAGITGILFLHMYVG